MSDNDFKMNEFSVKSLNEYQISFDEKEIRNFWRESIIYITFGFMFTLITFNFLWLQYILPTIGVVFLYIGFWKLRNESKTLNVAWIFSIINLMFNILNLIYVNTHLNANSENVASMAFLSTIFQISFLIVFRKGIKSIFNRENIIPKKDPILGLIIWRILIVIIAITGLGEIWLIFIPIIIYYFYSLRSIYKLSYKLENTNCMSPKDSIVINKKTFSLLYIISCIFIVGVCCLFSNHINLKSTEVIPVKEFATRNMLIDRGIPLEIVSDIVDEDISMLKNTINVEMFSEDLSFNSNSPNTLKATSIFIELKDNEMYAIEYFNWGEGGPYWQDGFAISNNNPLELINGRLLYESEDIKYSAKIPRLSGGLVTGIDIFGQESHEEKITGAVNYPHNSNNQRGYVFYKINIPIGTITGANLVNYIHYSHPFRIPYTEIEKNNIMFSDNLRQHYTNFSTKAKINQ